MAYSLHGLLAPALDRFAASPALIQGNRCVTYRELDEATSRVAAGLLALRRQHRGLFYVGVSSTVTVDSVIAVLGVLRAGLCYVPLDVLSPPERLERILDDARIQVAFVDPVAYPQAAALRGAALHTVLGLGNGSLDELMRAPPIPAHASLADDLAYVLYTSGSTGVPKGVMLTHRNAVTFVRWMAREFAIGAGDRVASRSPLNFDFSVFDIFTTLLCGAMLVIPEARAGKLAHADYVAMMEREQTTVLYATPSALMVLLDKGSLSPRVPLRLILYAGEPFHPAMLARLMRALPGARVANIYGPTETNIITCYWVKEPPSGPVPIGREVDDTEIIVVDDTRLCSVDEVGEIWARGGTVCIGYLGKPDLTAQRLVDSPFHPHPVKFWRTGDLGKRLPDGDLAYLGRADDMVKVRGYRIELGEVESALSAADGVAQAVVVSRPHERWGASLHAFVLLAPGAQQTAASLLAQAERRLPAYMLPAEVRIVDAFPYTSTGKVDRQRLKQT